MKLLAAAALALAAGLLAPEALADQTIARGPLDRPPPPELPDVDIAGPVRVGWGYSRLFRSRILSLGFEDELMVHRLSSSLSLGAVFGMDVQRALDDVPKPRSFLATGLGPAALFRPAEAGPAFILSGTGAPLWQSSDEKTSLVGFGVSARVETWPFYQSLVEAVECRRGTVATYLLSGLHGWALARHDWMGTSGDSYAVGFGLDLGRNVLLPVLGATLGGACAR